VVGVLGVVVWGGVETVGGDVVVGVLVWLGLVDRVDPVNDVILHPVSNTKHVRKVIKIHFISFHAISPRTDCQWYISHSKVLLQSYALDIWTTGYCSRSC
jgi:hypothetical protein